MDPWDENRFSTFVWQIELVLCWLLKFASPSSSLNSVIVNSWREKKNIFFVYDWNIVPSFVIVCTCIWISINIICMKMMGWWQNISRNTLLRRLLVCCFLLTLFMYFVFFFKIGNLCKGSNSYLLLKVLNDSWFVSPETIHHCYGFTQYYLDNLPCF